MRRVLEHTIDIDATPEQIWEALTGFDAYEGWNPFMRRVDGAAVVGRKLRIELAPPDGRRIVVSPSVVVADPASCAGGRAAAGALHRGARLRHHGR